MKRGKKKDQPQEVAPQDPAQVQQDGPRQAAQEAPPDELGQLRAERDDLLARLQRVSADYLNYQKRVQRDVEEARDFANAELIGGLLGVLDDMERLLEAAKANHGSDAPLLVGTRLVYEKALAAMERFGLAAMKPVGEHFDPHRHLALVQQASTEHPPGTVLAELQKGYLLKGRTIRPASVVVSKPAEAAETGQQQQEEWGDYD